MKSVFAVGIVAAFMALASTGFAQHEKHWWQKVSDRATGTVKGAIDGAGGKKTANAETNESAAVTEEAQSPAQAQGNLGEGPQDPKKDLEQKLRSAYQLSKMATLDRNNVTAAGTVFVVQKDGLAADLAKDATFITTKVENGQISQRGGAAALFSKNTTKRLTPGERVYLIDVDVKDDRLRIGMLTVEMIAIQQKGSTQQTRYRGYVDFEFDKVTMAAMNLETAKRTIESLLIPEDQVAGSKTIELNQTIEQVEAIFGKPVTVAKLGARTIYTYKDMKVVFTDGKVSDVQ